MVDPLRPGHELSYHPGETNLRMADIVVVNKTDSADSSAVELVAANVGTVNPRANIVMARSPVTLEPGPPIAGRRVLVVEDGPTITHGGMPFGAGTVAARQAGASEFVDPRPYAVGSIAETYAAYPAIGAVLPAMGYGDTQLAELGATIRAADCDTVVVGTPIDLGRLVDLGHPARRVTYELKETSTPNLAEILAPHIAKWLQRGSVQSMNGDSAMDVSTYAQGVRPEHRKESPTAPDPPWSRAGKWDRPLPAV